MPTISAIFNIILNFLLIPYYGIYGAAIASKRSGNLELANMYFKELLQVSAGVNSNRPEIAEANAFIAELTL